MLTLLLAAQAHAATARVTWRAGVGRVEIAAPGEHVAADAPTTLSVGDDLYTLRGDPAALRFPVAPGPLAVELRVSLCADTSTACRSVVFAAVGTAGARGTLDLAEGATLPEEAAASAAKSAPGADAPVGATASGVVKVIDFGAVWCPPCNLMSAEVLELPGGTAGVPVEAVDVDQPASWALKDRYAVGGYPTLVAVTAEGVEVDRLVGYPGAAETRAWFARLGQVVPLARLVAGGAGDAADGLRVAADARRLAEAGYTDVARALLPRAAASIDLRVARLLVDPTEADAAWLFESDVPPGDWVFAALDAAPARWTAAAKLAARVPPARGADYLYAAAQHAPPDVAPALKAASHALLRAALTGDVARDRGHATFLAQLLAETGDVDGALALLDAHAARWPNEFTFTHAAARHLLTAGRLPEAETRARAALAAAWGDQRLRAAVTLAKILVARGQPADALRAIDAALAEVPAPAADIAVRTTRYRAELDALRATVAPR